VTSLFISCLYFIGAHFLLSHHRIRTTLLTTLGTKPFFAVYSLIATSGLLLIIYHYLHITENPMLFVPNRFTRTLGMLGMYIAVLFLVLAIWQNKLSQKKSPIMTTIASPQGIYRVTRHPLLMASTLWSISHILINGHQAMWIVAGSLLVLNLFGIRRIDHRKHLILGNRWQDYLKETSVIPFMAIVQKRNQMVWREFHPLAPIVTLCFYGFIYFMHQYSYAFTQ
jgi:uncharacterized membrane protein